MTSWLERLVELVPPPPGYGGVEFDWAPTEEVLGRQLPSTFKQLVHTYGDVDFGGRLFSLRHPSPHWYLDVLESTRLYRETLDVDELAEPPEVLPAGVRIESTELIKWGDSDRGEHCLWHTGNDDPDQWTIVLTDSAQQNWSFHDMTVPEFIFRWLSKDLTPPQLHKEWDRDEYFQGKTPYCEFFTYNEVGVVVSTSKLVLDVLADTVVVPESAREWTFEELEARPAGDRLTDNVPNESQAIWPPPPGSPPPSRLPFPPRDLGMPVLDPDDHPGSRDLELVSGYPATGMASLDNLLHAVSPISGREPLDWVGTESALGRVLPAEYKACVDIYGDVLVGNVFRPYHPSRFTGVDMVGQTREFHESVTRFPPGQWPEDTVMAQLDLTAENTVVWGGAVNGDYHLWHVTGDNPDEWTILLVGAYFHDWYTFTGSVPELIYRWLTDDLPDLPDYWNKDTRLHGQPMQYEFGPYDPNGKPIATYDVILHQ